LIGRVLAFIGECPESEEGWDADMRKGQTAVQFLFGAFGAMDDRSVPRIGHAQKQIFGRRERC